MQLDLGRGAPVLGRALLIYALVLPDLDGAGIVTT